MIESKVKYLCKNTDGDHFYLESDDFCDSLESAIQKAEEMREKGPGTSVPGPWG